MAIQTVRVVRTKTRVCRDPVTSTSVPSFSSLATTKNIVFLTRGCVTELTTVSTAPTRRTAVRDFLHLPSRFNPRHRHACICIRVSFLVQSEFGCNDGNNGGCVEKCNEVDTFHYCTCDLPGKVRSTEDSRLCIGAYVC